MTIYNRVLLGPGYYPKVASGSPIALGSLYVGEVDLDPEVVVNQKTLSVQQEDGTIVAVTQPLSLSAGGVPLYDGSPVVPLVEGSYSLKVLDSAGSQVYYVPTNLTSTPNYGDNYFYPDASEADQGAATGGMTTVKDIVDSLVATSSLATIVFSRGDSGALTNYTFLTTEVIPYNIKIVVENGALLYDAAGSADLTIQGPFDPGKYQVFNWAGTGNVLFTYPVTVKPEWWATNTTPGTTDMADAIVAAFEAIPQKSVVRLNGKYAVASSLALNVPSWTTVDAYGSEIIFTTDASGIDFNTLNTSQLAMFRWLGGKLLNNAGTKTASTAMEFSEFRNVVVRDAHFQGFWKAIYFTGRDTFNFSYNYFFDNTYCIYGDQPNSVAGISLLLTQIENNHFSISGETSAIYLLGGVYYTVIRNNSFNGDATEVICIDNTGASASTRGFDISNNHFEQGLAGSTLVYFKDDESLSFLGINITGNSFGSGLVYAVVLEHCRSVFLSSNTFSQTIVGGGTSLNLNVDCLDISIDRSNVFSDALIVWTCDRDEISFGEAFVRTPSMLANYDGDSFMSGKAVIDMSTEYSGFPTLGIPPKGYLINVQIKDSGSSGATAGIELAEADSIPSDHSGLLNISNYVPNDQIIGAQFFVSANDDGDIHREFTASGTTVTATLDVWLKVEGYYM